MNSVTPLYNNTEAVTIRRMKKEDEKQIKAYAEKVKRLAKKEKEHNIPK